MREKKELCAMRFLHHLLCTADRDKKREENTAPSETEPLEGDAYQVDTGHTEKNAQFQILKLK